MAHVTVLGGNRYRPTRTGSSHSFPVVCGPPVGLGCTGGPPRRGRRQLPRSREDPDRANQPAPVSLRRWAPAFASPAISLASHRGENVPGTRQSSSLNHIPGLQPGPIPHGRSPRNHHPACCRGAMAGATRPHGGGPIPGETTWNQNSRPGNPVPAPSAAEPWPAGRTGTAPTSRACTAENSSTCWLPRMACPRGNRTALHHRRCETGAG